MIASASCWNYACWPNWPLADWPGVKEADLYEKRDLKATTDLRAVLKGLLRDHLRLPESALAQAVFPNSPGAAPLAGLVRA